MKVLFVNPIVRAIGVFAAVAVLVTGVTYAALSSTATMTDSSVTTATASLKIWDGDSYESTAPGFAITNLVPGSGSTPQPFYLQNGSAIDLDVTVSVDAGSGYVLSAGLTEADVKVKFVGDFCNEEEDTTLADLIDTTKTIELPCNALNGNAAGNSGVEGAEGNYKIVFDLDTSEVDGSSAQVTGLDFVFTGTESADEPS